MRLLTLSIAIFMVATVTAQSSESVTYDYGPPIWVSTKGRQDGSFTILPIDMGTPTSDTSPFVVSSHYPEGESASESVSGSATSTTSSGEAATSITSSGETATPTTSSVAGDTPVPAPTPGSDSGSTSPTARSSGTTSTSASAPSASASVPSTAPATLGATGLSLTLGVVVIAVVGYFM